jgi:hypothetical protein
MEFDDEFAEDAADHEDGETEVLVDLLLLLLLPANALPETTTSAPPGAAASCRPKKGEIIAVGGPSRSNGNHEKKN